MSTLRTSAIQSPSTTNGGISIDTSGHVTVDGVQLPSAGPLSNRNKIINGDMRIDQRYNGSSVSFSNTSGYAVDRSFCMLQGSSATGTLTFQQSTDAPTGFTNSIKATVTVADTTNTQAYIGQFVEGYNWSDMCYGTANAKTVTLSFWVKSSIAGLYCGGITGGGSAGNQVGYVFEYTINSANTWEYKTVTIPGETSGSYTFDSTNGTGIRLKFDLGTKGSTFVAAPNAWTANLKYSTSTAGRVYWKENSGATFYLTGVQLEVGSVATPFERRSYGDELARCQRYCQVHDVSGSGELIAHGVGNGTTTSSQIIRPFVPFRSAPALTISSAGDFQIQFVGSATTTTCSSLSLITGTTSSNYVYIDCGITGGTAGQGQYLRSQNANAVLTLSAEL